MTATLIYPIDGGYKRRVNRPAASAVAKAAGWGSCLEAFASADPAERQKYAAGPNLRNLAISYGTGRFVAPTRGAF